MIPREIRLNNPGGIKKTSQHWFGSSNMQDDPVFIRFDSPVLGLRAMMKVLLNYQDVHDIDTVKGIIDRWAPPIENNTEAYIQDVTKRLGVSTGDHIDLEMPDTLIRLTQAIVRHECGHCPDPTLPYWFAEEIYEAAAMMALGHDANS